MSFSVSVIGEIGCEEGIVEPKKNSDNDEQSDNENPRITITNKKVEKIQRKEVKRRSIKIRKEREKQTDSSESEAYEIQPTRSGRIPKRPKKSEMTSKISKGKNKEPKKPKKIKKMNQKIVNSPKQNNNDHLHTMSKESSDFLHAMKENEMECSSQTLNDKTCENRNDSLEKSKTNELNMFEEIADDVRNMSDLKPGSLVVLKKDCTDDSGKDTLQVYMVGDDFNVNNPNYRDSLLPIDLSPEVLASVTNCIKDIEPQNLLKIDT